MQGNHINCKLQVRLNKRRGESYGFDLTSMTSLRGHYVEAVSRGGRAEAAGMAQGDLIRSALVRFTGWGRTISEFLLTQLWRKSGRISIVSMVRNPLQMKI